MKILDKEISTYERFTEGDCHVLAITLHRMSNEALQIGVTVPHYHAFAFNPMDSYALDIDGYRSVRELVTEWGVKGWEIVDADFFNKKKWAYECYYGSWDEAMKIGEQLLKEYKL